MRDEEILSRSTMQRQDMFRQATGWWRLAPFVTILVLLLGTAAIGAVVGTPSNGSANARGVDFARAAQ